MTDTQREAFEAHMRSRGEDYLYRRDAPGCTRLGEYCRENVQECWLTWQAAQAALSGAAQEDTIDNVSKALRHAWQLGQTYWHQADHEFYSENRKSDETQRKFNALVDETRAMLLAAPAAINAELVEALEGVIRVADRATDEFDRARAALSRAKEQKS